MPKKKKQNQATQFQKLAKRLEKTLGLGGEKTHQFIEGLSKELGPLLQNLEMTILSTRSLPFGLIKDIATDYFYKWALTQNLSWESILQTTQEIGALMKEWVKPEKLYATFAHVAFTYFNKSEHDETDEFGMDPQIIEAVRPIVEFLYNDYWRVTLKGIKNISAHGRCLLVGNHSGGLPYDGAMITMSIHQHLEKQGREARRVRFLIEDFVYHFPFMGTFMNRIGAVRACPENALRLLNNDALVLVFPEGVKGLGKLYADRYQLKRFGRGGFIKLAIQTGAPIIPVAVIGAEEIHPILWKSDILAKALGIPYLPVTPTFPWLGPIGLLPFPTKWTIVFGKPISFKKYKPKQAEDELLVQKLSDQVQHQIERMIKAELKKRKTVWLG